MTTTSFHTADLARAAGVHPNTIRRYADSGLLPPVPRGANSYRLFTQAHLDCLRVVRVVYATPFRVHATRLSASQIIQRAAAEDWGGALERAHAHLAQVQAERERAETAARLLEHWATSPAAEVTMPPITAPPLRIGPAARLLGVSIDVLRNWERNGLLAVPRDAHNRYRAYGPADISRLRVIRMLSRAGYSQMAILRMLLQLDRGVTANLRQALDTPAPDEDARIAADRWLSTLAAQEEIAHRLIALIEDVISTQAIPTPPSTRPTLL
jgi:DNA-binding transcriptional MerR regulator